MKKTDAFILRKIYGKNILMPICKNEIGDVPIVLNEVAGVIWDLVEDNINRQQLQSEICKKYELSDNSEEAMAVAEFINQLIELKLVIE
ncbi:MAG: PqqD family protein [Lachnospiraceae bacterium]|nr:PqqD family protein [Lachnospiraceae bacterium]